MTQFLQYFFTTSLFISVAILVVMALRALLAQKFTARLRYVTWLIVLLGLVIPLRPLVGGLITIDVPVPITLEQAQQLDNAGLITSDAEPAQEIQSSARSTASVFQTVAIVWLSVALAVFAYHMWKYIRFRKLIKRWSTDVTDESILVILRAMQTEKELANKKIGLKRCGFISTSMIVGFVRPVVLLPEKDFDADELELIFRHELIHYKRGDLFVKLLSVIAMSLHWFNPVIYWMNAAMQADCEASCDAAVLTDVGNESNQFYAELIMDMIGSTRSKTALSTCFYGTKRGIQTRMSAIMNGTSKVGKISFSIIMILVILMVFFGSALAFSSQTTSEVDASEPYPSVPWQQLPATTQTQEPTTAAPTTASPGSDISLQRAIEIAYADLVARGINATFHRHSGIDWEYGQRVWELLFRTHGERMPFIEYYINAENGNIVKFEWDD